MPDPSLALKRFDVALSFPGEHRTFVEAVAARLSAVLGKEHILYDKYYEAEFGRPNLDVYLPALYRTQSELIVLFLCPKYAAKRWCNLEWRHIRDLLASLEEKRIMFLRYGYEGDFTELGILRGDGTIDFKGRPADDIADVIVERFKINGGQIRTNGQPPKETALPPPVDISRIDRYAPAGLIGREAETKLIEDAWAKAVASEAQRPRVMAFVALGGEGKTALVARWAVDMAEKGWPDAEAAFGWSFYSQGSSEQQASSSDLFLPRRSSSSARRRSTARARTTKGAASPSVSAPSAPRSSSTASSRCNIRRPHRLPGN
jgi:TIR domain